MAEMTKVASNIAAPRCAAAAAAQRTASENAKLSDATRTTRAAIPIFSSIGLSEENADGIWGTIRQDANQKLFLQELFLVILTDLLADFVELFLGVFAVLPERP